MSQRDRILKLEAVILRMNSLVESLGDQLARSDALALQPHLESSLRNIVATCASLAKEVDQSKLDGHLHSPQSRIHHEDPSHRQQDQAILLYPSSPMHVPNPEVPNAIEAPQSLMSLPLSPGNVTSPRSPSTTTSPVELSTFINQLRLACAHNAFETLSDPAVSLDTVRNKFRFLLSLMSREHLTSYYKASLEAQIDRSALKPWESVPFFGLGGAGSHYSRQFSSTPPSGPAKDSAQRDWPLVGDPLLPFSAQIRESLDDTWFDVRDLEGYLKEKDVYLVASPLSTPQREVSAKHTDVVRLLQGV